VGVACVTLLHHRPGVGQVTNDDALLAYAKLLRRKAVAAGKTWVGRHWPDTRQLGRDGVGVDFSERGPAVRSYLAAVEPEIMVELLDAFLAARRWIAAEPPSADSERKQR
jgi:hypothetical protein